MTGLCDVCGTRGSVGTYSIPGMPMSAAYCNSCINIGAHPWWALVAKVALSGGWDQMAIPYRLAFERLVENTCKCLGRTMQDFNADLQKEVELLLSNPEAFQPTASRS